MVDDESINGQRARIINTWHWMHDWLLHSHRRCTDSGWDWIDFFDDTTIVTSGQRMWPRLDGSPREIWDGWMSAFSCALLL